MKVLLVDFDGVLRVWPTSVDHAIETCWELAPGSIHATAFANERLLPAITGQISDQQWRAATAAALETVYPGRQVAAAVAAWSQSAGQLCIACVELIRQCRNRTRIVLATNATNRLVEDLRILGIENDFHAIANSSEIGFAKPDPRFFQAALNLARVPAAETFMVDDKLFNIAAAGRLGIKGHVYISTSRFQRALQDWGLLADPL